MSESFCGSNVWTCRARCTGAGVCVIITVRTVDRGDPDLTLSASGG